MKRQYDLVVFDWEGTLAEDSFGYVLSVIAKEATRMNLADFDKSRARQYMTYGLTTMISRLLPDLSMRQHEQFIQNIQDELKRNPQEVCLMDGAAEVVKKIHDSGFKLAIATNRSLKSLQRVLQLSNLEKYFPVIRTVSEAPPKPCPQMLEEILMESAAPVKRTVMIGDSVTDIEMARSINVDAIGVDFYQEQENILLEAGAKFVLRDYKGLLKYLEI